MRYYGQFNPPLDQLLHERYFVELRDGVFFESGATDGVMESTCKFFEESMHWSGINIEPVPFLFQQLSLNRPQARNLNLALSNADGEATFTHAVHPVHGLQFGNGSLKHSTAHLDDLLRQGCKFLQFPVRTARYDELVNELADSGALSRLDLMVLDVEGHELEALEGMREARLLPRVLCVESTISDRATLHAAVEALGYTFDVTMHNNSVFVRN
jgi:FkbM family methyltransferase